jgi:transposase
VSVPTAELDITAVLDENARLRAQLYALVDELTKTRSEADARISALTAEISKLTKLVAKSTDRIDELLAIVGRKQRKDPPAKPPAAPPTLDAEAAEAFDKRPLPPEPPERAKPDPKPHRPTGRKKLPESLPVEETTLVPACANCGRTDCPIVDEVTEEKLTVEVKAHKRRLTHRKTVHCDRCELRTTAEAPPAPFARSKITCEWLAWLMVEKYVKLVPPDRIRRYLGVQGLVMAMSTLVSFDDAAGELLDAIDGEHWKNLRASSHMQVDASGLKVIVPGSKKAHNGYIEVFKHGPTVVFQYTPEKSGDTFAAKFIGYEGIVVADAEHRNNRVFDSPNILEAGCNAHFRRKFRDAEGAQPVLAVEGGKYISAIYDVEEAAKKQGLTGDALRDARQACLPLFDDLNRWMAAVEPTLVPSDPLAATIRYYANHGVALRRFIDHPDIPIDNSGAEREYQALAKLRLNMLFAGSTDAAHRDAVLLGIVATCRNLDVDPTAYLTWAFERRGTARERFGNLPASELTPAAYKASLRPISSA